ncbi:hypothetical protein F511_02651 [Dorcoceras hygrometricum]|uniref:Dystroglycan-like n=1 Tax=Dorcoceras hygrometricum TaxID=472368 RepID=A0A2Z7D6K0_9LAMI|nr:hypothetical protein F511_02651 [Dorcoceras hygrometricum]
MLCVGIVVADVSFAAGSLARCVLCFGSWRQQRLRGFQQDSAIEFRTITLISGFLSFVILSEMASSLIGNTNQVHFASVLSMDNAEMVAMFEALVASGLNGFLGCMSDIFETAPIEFYQNASVRDGKVVSTVQGKLVEISEEIFSRTFQLPVEGLIDINEVPKDLIFDARTEFSFTGEQLTTSCKKRELKIEYRLLSDIVAKSITVKAGSFDFLPVEGLIDINEVPKDLIFDARTEFSFTGEQLTTSCKKRELKIEYRLLSDIVAKSITVKAGSFDFVTHERFMMMTAIFGGVSINWGIFLFKIFKDMVTPETRQDRGYVVHIYILLKNIPNLELGEYEEFPPLKILTAKTVGRYIAINDKISVENVEGLARKSLVKKTPVKRAVSKKSHAVAVDEQVMKKKRTLKGKAAPSKAKLKLVSVALDVEPIQTIDPTSDDDVYIIIEQVIADTAPLDTDVGSPAAQRNDKMEHWFNLLYEEYVAREAKQLVDSANDTDEHSVAAKATGIDTVMGAADNVVTEELSLAKDVATMTESEDIGSVSKPLELNVSTTSDEESMSLEDILKQIPEDVMLPSVTTAEITKIKFAASIEISGVHEGHPARDMFNLICADIDFLVQLREKAGQPSTATDLQIISLFSNAHVFAVETLQTQMRIHGLKWDRICSSRFFEGENRYRGAVIARSNISTRSLCWQRTKTLAEGSWVIQEGNDLWQRLPKQTVPLTIELSPQRKFEDTLSLVNIVAISTVKDIAVDASNFVGVFRRGTDVHMILSESSSSSSGSAHPDPAVLANFSQRPLDTDLTSPNPSTTDSRVFFTTDDTPMGVDKILMPTVVTLTQLSALVSQISTERVQTRNDSDRLQDMLLMEVRRLEKKITEMLINRTASIEHRKIITTFPLSWVNLLPKSIVVMTKRGKRVAAADLNRLLMIKTGPVGEAQAEEVVLVEVAEEMIEGGSSTKNPVGEAQAEEVVLVEVAEEMIEGGSSTKRGSGSSGAGGPYKKNAELWLYGKNQF